MLSARQRKAVSLLFEMPDDEVARRLGIRAGTLRRWKGRKDFADALDYADRTAHESTDRMVRGVKTQAAAKLREMVAESGTAKTDAKTLVDFLKATGVLTTSEESDGNRLLFEFLQGESERKREPKNED